MFEVNFPEVRERDVLDFDVSFGKSVPVPRRWEFEDDGVAVLILVV
jgi:hypothetical protein